MMDGTALRLELSIDIFEKLAQRALALPDITRSQLIEAILVEFNELEYLNQNPALYQLLIEESGATLEEGTPLGYQIRANAHLVLTEQETYLPEGTHRPTRSVYLRETSSRNAWKINWVPAIIGRTSVGQSFNRHIALDLQNMATGLRVSRRHFYLEERDGSYALEITARNPVTITRDGEEVVRGATQGRYSLQHDDIIRLDRSDIHLKFIVRDEPPLAEPPTGSEEPTHE